MVTTVTDLRAGDVLIFEGDIPHRGCSYTEPCSALHVYLDVTGVVREADPNTHGSFHRVHGRIFRMRKKGCT